jgi:hypothetical protein
MICEAHLQSEAVCQVPLAAPKRTAWTSDPRGDLAMDVGHRSMVINQLMRINLVTHFAENDKVKALKVSFDFDAFRIAKMISLLTQHQPESQASYLCS